MGGCSLVSTVNRISFSAPNPAHVTAHERLRKCTKWIKAGATADGMMKQAEQLFRVTLRLVKRRFLIGQYGDLRTRQFRERAPAMLRAMPPAINTTLMMGETRSL